jgi:hypothetical protein
MLDDRQRCVALTIFWQRGLSHLMQKETLFVGHLSYYFAPKRRPQSSEARNL